MSSEYGLSMLGLPCFEGLKRESPWGSGSWSVDARVDTGL
jgi:hypothetical protein